MDENVMMPRLFLWFFVCAVVMGVLVPLGCEGGLEDFLGEEPATQPAERVAPSPVKPVVSGRAPKPDPDYGYAAEWESLDKRPTPAWFSDAKFGIFIHWGVYSVPAWGPRTDYAEWYLRRLRTKGSETEAFHKRVYGEDFAYEDFAPLFTAELYDPDEWAELFVRSGARYVVLTSKHHDGYCLWPSKESKGWNAVDNGPGRDLLGELTRAVRKTDVKMGFYYSLYEWYHPLYQTDVDKYVTEHMLGQIKDLVVRYEPDIVWTDGEWEHPSSTWRSEEFLAWLFNESPVGEWVVVNDRWGKETRHVHGGYFTTEYGSGLAAGHPWEECRGMGHSFGYNRNETVFDYRSPRRIIHTLIEIVSRGGNLLLDIGPTGDGRIPVIMQERLVQIGEWLDVNGEAIYGTRPWVKTHDEKEFTIERIDPQIDFDWHRGSPDETITGDNFSARWTSFIEPRYSEEYTFELFADSRGGLWIDNRLIIDDLKEKRKWGGSGTGRIMLDAQKMHSIRVEFFEDDRNAVARLSWSSASQEKEIVPQSRLYSTRDLPDGLTAVYKSVGSSMCYTCKGDAVYCISLERPGKEIVVPNIPGLRPGAVVTMLGRAGKLPWKHEGGNLVIDLSQIRIDGLPCEWAWVIKIDGGFVRR